MVDLFRRGAARVPFAMSASFANKVYIAGPFYGGLAHITAGAVQSAPNGNSDLVYARLSADGAAVEYATYLGGDEGAGKWQAAVDNRHRRQERLSRRP
ncbi:MAG: hypothetical protein R3C42_02680 [Parvularculaceae bacterium]